MTRECVGAILRAKGYKVVVASTTEGAVVQMNHQLPELIIHDLDLSDGKAEELIDSVCEMAGEHLISFFAFTHQTDRSRLLSVIERGSTQVMIKQHFTIKLFFGKVDAMLRARELSIAKAKADIQNANPDQGPPERTPSPESKTVSTIQSKEKKPASSIGPLITREESQLLLKSIKPIMPKSEAFDLINQVAELKALSPTVARVLSLTRSSEASMEAITKSIRNDHAIALKIIRIANSTAFSRGDPITTFHEAVLRMGCEQIRQTVINIEIMENFSGNFTRYIDHRLFWEHSIAVATCCSLIARESRQFNPDEAFTLGLLHDVGRMILYQAFGDDYIEVIRFSRENHFPIELIERRMLLMDHASIMNTVLHQWGLHNDLVEPIVNHHLSVGNIRQACSKRIESVCMVALANKIVHGFGIGSSGNQTVYATDEYFEALNLPQGFLAIVSEKLPEMVLDMRYSMLGQLGDESFPEPGFPCQDLMLNPIFVTLNPNTDVIGKWIEALRGHGAEESPANLIVAHIRKQRDAVSIDQKIRDYESENDLQKLPVIILSNSGELNLPEISRVDRVIRTMPLPFTYAQFERVAHSIPDLMTTAQTQIAA